ncbi:MAG: hypothetical protein O9256_00260 [Rhizobiaceae bacterium]|nr:hypothetical protein [Rhizobiaceae bacterium]
MDQAPTQSAPPKPAPDARNDSPQAVSRPASAVVDPRRWCHLSGQGCDMFDRHISRNLKYEILADLQRRHH